MKNPEGATSRNAGGKEEYSKSVEGVYNREQARLRGWERALDLFEDRAGSSFEQTPLLDRMMALSNLRDDIDAGIIDADYALANAVGAMMFVTEHDLKREDAHAKAAVSYPSLALH